ncbi:MAG TPA: uroporphyrinogen-III synthase [Stellaceae bacterium]|jgi:uroporphyrinogen-III synthase|nr:uroporphyrinogen-III synthase [Stellaceae bacterium]
MVDIDRRALAGRTIVVPETRELDIFVRMLEERGAVTIRCPLIAIHDAPDATPVEAWLHRFNGGACDDLILLTGEGLRRLYGFACRAGIEAPFVARLALVRTITRGPKPARALRELGLRLGVPAETPTTDGVIAALARLDLAGRRVGVQLYPDNPHEKLLGFIAGAGATADPVSPYVYASAADDRRVEELIDRLAVDAVDVIAFTSAPQVRRLIAVAEAAGKTAVLRAGLARIRVAAIGPVVASALERFGARVDIAPKENFLMKPLVNAMIAALGA